MSRTRRAAVVLLITVLAGCGGAEPTQPGALPSPPSPTASPSVSPTAALSPTPLDDRAAVEAAVRYYYDGFGRAASTGDAQELAKGSTPDYPCRSAVALTADVLSKGRIEGNQVSVRQVRVIEVQPSRASAQVTYTAADGRVVGADGREVQKLKGEPRGNSAIELRKRDGVRLVANVVRLEG